MTGVGGVLGSDGIGAGTEIPRLRPPEHRVDRRAIGWWSTQAIIGVAVPAVVLAVLALLIAPARPWLLLALAVVLVFGIAYVAVMPTWRYRVHRWETTDTAVYTQAGWFNQDWRVAPMSRIQTVDTVRGPLQQMFGLSAVTVTTASAAGPITISGLDRQVAADLVSKLTAATEAAPGDAT